MRLGNEVRLRDGKFNDVRNRPSRTRPDRPAADLDGVMIFDPEGQLIGRIALPERCANLCFGGRQRNRLFMACGHGLYALYVNAQGAV